MTFDEEMVQPDEEEKTPWWERVEWKPIGDMPQWARNYKIRFEYAPSSLKIFLRKMGKHPSYYAVRKDPKHGNTVDMYIVWGPRLGWITVFPEELIVAGALTRRK